MKQTKKKSQKKQPVKVQLSKDDLKGLLTTLRNCIVEELLIIHKQYKERVLNLEIGQACLRSELRVLKTLPNKQDRREIKRISYCPHKILVFKSVQYLKESSVLSSVTYECESCGLEWLTLPCFLTRKEKKALKNLGVRV